MPIDKERDLFYMENKTDGKLKFKDSSLGGDNPYKHLEIKKAKTEEEHPNWEVTKNILLEIKKLQMEEDKIKPKHYHTSNDVYQFCLDNDLGGLEMNVIKYVSRWKKKNGIEDLRKARETLDRLIKYNVE